MLACASKFPHRALLLCAVAQSVRVREVPSENWAGLVRLKKFGGSLYVCTPHAQHSAKRVCKAKDDLYISRRPQE